MDRPRLEAREIVVIRRGVRLVDGASLRVMPGEIASISGASGSGKTTFLKAISTLIRIDGGSVVLEGEDALSLSPPAFRRRVGRPSAAADARGIGRRQSRGGAATPRRSPSPKRRRAPCSIA